MVPILWRLCRTSSCQSIAQALFLEVKCPDDEVDQHAAKSGTAKLAGVLKSGARRAEVSMLGNSRIHFAGVVQLNLRATPSPMAPCEFTTSSLFQGDAPNSRLQDLGLSRPCFISWVEHPWKFCRRPDVRCQPGTSVAMVWMGAERAPCGGAANHRDVMFVCFTFKMTCPGGSPFGVAAGSRGTADHPLCRLSQCFSHQPWAQTLSINCTSKSRELLNRIRVRGRGEQGIAVVVGGEGEVCLDTRGRQAPRGFFLPAPWPVLCSPNVPFLPQRLLASSPRNLSRASFDLSSRGTSHFQHSGASSQY
jgi:hypothetical protein